MLALLLSGCAGLFDREVYTEEPYETAAEVLETEDPADAISNYAALRRAINRLVTEHTESAQLQFQNYDGSISEDISTACWEVKSSTPLGAFAVDYISYDLSRIVSYYQAEIHITYKRSAYQVEALEHLENLSAMRSRLAAAMRGGETYLVMELAAASLTADTVARSMEAAYYADPTTCPVLPQAETAVYPESGVTRILEVSIDYGMDGESLALRREELAAALDELLAAALPEEFPADTSEEPAEAADGDEGMDASERLRALCDALAARVTADETAGATAWDAFTQGAASSEGAALALEAACQAAGIDCEPVFGRLDGEEHVWNIVSIADASYHVDLTSWDRGEDAVFLLGDGDIAGAYWWDTGAYPACPARWGASEEASAEFGSVEPETVAAG